ncbi:LPS export ABC transporter permease LptG [Aestuariibius sp. 2305UL40-4]|uniref:LPS export ABC transporter permease LptG n=1 Tax=Aestuariibius violaceus TaxID=3234132 RepID=UPI00345E1B2C
MILHLYFAKRFARTFAGVFAVFFLMIAFLDLIEQLGKFAGEGVGFGRIVGLTLLNTPEGVYRILPLITVLATIALFLSLARSSEMVVTRAAGRSALRSLVAPTIVAFMIGAASVAVLNPIVAGTQQEYERREADIERGGTSTLALSEEGLWLRQGDGDQQTVIRAESASLDGTRLARASFIVFGEGSGPTRRLEAARAELRPGEWALEDVKAWPLGTIENPEAAATRHDRLTLPSTLTRDQIRDRLGTPSSIPIWDLPAFIEQLERAGFSSRRHLVWFQMELALPAFLVSMLLVAAGLTMRHQRGGRTGIAVLIAVMLGFGLYFLRNFAQILGENGQIPAIIAAWIPPSAAICLALGLLLHLEDG